MLSQKYGILSQSAYLLHGIYGYCLIPTLAGRRLWAFHGFAVLPLLPLSPLPRRWANCNPLQKVREGQLLDPVPLLKGGDRGLEFGTESQTCLGLLIVFLNNRSLTAESDNLEENWNIHCRGRKRLQRRWQQTNGFIRHTSRKDKFTLSMSDQVGRISLYQLLSEK